MAQHSLPRRPSRVVPAASPVALLLVGAAIALLVGQSLAEGSAPLPVAVTAGLLFFAAFAGACRMVGRGVSR